MKNILIGYWNDSSVTLAVFIVLSVMCNGCSSIVPPTTNSGKKYFETFYIGKEGTQNFIKPILFKDERSNEELILDMTFRYRNAIKDSAIVNFSIKSATLYKTIDSLKIANEVIQAKSSELELLFNEKNKKGFTSRYSTKASLQEIKEIYSNNTWEITIYFKNQITRYKPQRKTMRAIDAVRDNVFIVM
ncbi:hypothetical protein [Cyclobacterium xiamenense]|uniref:hypothetical protein n=1 Tax=Cyclobacterium xiamenense TaxID=1297121 RepID=UPI0012B79AB5|nr:hypothetical protein [Cyclobacterium xiamenense]